MARLLLVSCASLFAGTMVLVLRPVQASEPPAKVFTAAEVAFFEKDVQPIVTQRCLKCHGAEAKIKGGLRLTSRAEALKGGDTGPAVALDKPDSSLLLSAINYKDGLEMPPSGKLPQAEIDTLTQWVKAGLPWSAGGTSAAPKPTAHAKGGVVTPEARQYWAYQPVKRPPVPEIRNPKSPIRNPIDAFIQAPLEAKGLTPAAPADPVALVRRAYYDLTGLPPTPEEVDAFLAAIALSRKRPMRS